MSIPVDAPRLTELPGEKHPLVCQSCGGSSVRGQGNGILRLSLSRWQEHDHLDRPENKLIVLCNKCSERMIKPHVRLYGELQLHQPWPGCMPICVYCEHRVGIICPIAKANGGAGITLSMPKPLGAMVDATKYRGPLTIYTGPVHGCSRKDAMISEIQEAA